MDVPKKYEKSTIGNVWVVVCVVLICLFAGYYFGQTQRKEIKKVNLYETVEKKVLPDEGIVVFVIETESENPNLAIEENTKINNKVLRALSNYKVETTQYNLERIQKWDKEKEEFIETGYKVRNTIKVTSLPEEMGTIIKTGIENGANRIEYISYQISQQKLQEIKANLLKEAIENARNRAEAIAIASNTKLGKILEISPSEAYVPIFRYEAISSYEKDIPQISPAEQTVRYGVSIVFELK
ncbi:MAG: SIMPL domain-containing protein [Candidatus Woesearchaeota archaeon]